MSGLPEEEQQPDSPEGSIQQSPPGGLSVVDYQGDTRPINRPAASFSAASSPTDADSPAAPPASTAAGQATDSSPQVIPTYIHPVSEGGSITWSNHRDLVFYRGKDRGPRNPPPSFPRGYISRGPLKDFNFDMIRNRGRKAPLSKFRDEYADKQTEVPTELVTEIVEYFEFNENEQMMYLADQAARLQNLDFLIRAQELQINQMKEDLAEMSAVKAYSAERGEKIKELTQNVTDGEAVIQDLKKMITDLEEGKASGREGETDEYIQRLLARLEENQQAAARSGSAQPQQHASEPQSTSQTEEIERLMQELQIRQDQIEKLEQEMEQLQRERAAQSASTQDVGTTTSSTASVDAAAAAAAAEAQVTQLSATIATKDQQIARLQQQIRGLEAAAARTTAAAPPTLASSSTTSTTTTAATPNTPRTPQFVDPRPRLINLISNARTLTTSIHESRIRVHNLHAESYLRASQAPAAISIAAQADAIWRLTQRPPAAPDSPSNTPTGLSAPASLSATGRAALSGTPNMPEAEKSPLRGKSYYLSARAKFAEGWLPEAVEDLNRARANGFDGACAEESEGEQVDELLAEVRAQLRDRERARNYPPGSSSSSSLLLQAGGPGSGSGAGAGASVGQRRVRMDLDS